MADPRTEGPAAAERSRVLAQNGGFTLAEMLAALGILLVGITALLGALGTSVGERRTTDARLAASKFADVAMHRIRHEAIQRAQGADSDLDLEVATLTDQTVPGFPGMSWSAEAITDELRPDIWLIRLEIRWLDEGEDSSETFYRILPRTLPLGQRVRRFKDARTGG